MSLNHVPISPRVGVEGRTLKNYCGPTTKQRTVRRVSVTSDPSTVSYACKNVIRPQVEGGLSCVRCVQGVTPCRVNKSFGLRWWLPRNENYKTIYDNKNVRTCPVLPLV